jgi:ubiquinone biosynthesis O-methyltransferase
MTHPEQRRAVPALSPEAYARWRGSELGATTERLERKLVLELAGDIRGCKILDIGCGDGALTIDLARLGADVAGIDASAEMIDAAKERARRRNVDVAFYVASAGNLPFGREQFDVVTAITILCFVDDAAPVFREIARVLRPGGRVVIGELGKWSSWAAARRVRAWLGASLWRQGRFRTAKALTELARQADLVVTEQRGAIYYPRSRLAARLLSPCDAALGRLTTLGAGFVAIAATKPPSMRAEDHPAGLESASRAG